MLYSDDQVAHFDDLSKKYKKRVDRVLKVAGGDSDFFYRAKMAILQERFRATPSRILDYGCGPGRMTPFLRTAYPSAHIFGFDPSPKSIDIARQTLRGLGNVEFSESLPGERERYDLAIASGVFHHIPPQAWAENMDNIARRLSPGGMLFVFEHNPINLLARLLLVWGGEDKGAKLVYPGQMRRLMTEAGLVQLQLKFISFFPSYFRMLLPLEKKITWLPLGAQYYTEGITGSTR